MPRRPRPRWGSPPRTASIATVLLTAGLLTAGATTSTQAAAPATLEYDVASGWTSQAVCSVVPERPRGAVGSGACFGHDGDVFVVSDAEEDGQSVGVRWRASGGRFGLCRNKSGYDSRTRGGLRCNKNLPEGERLVFYVGYCSVSSTKTCRRYADYTAWSAPVRTWTHKAGVW